MSSATVDAALRSSVARTIVLAESFQLVCCASPPPRVAARRKLVTDAARQLFAAQGFQNSRMTEISAAAGIKVGQIYRDFHGKEAIVAEIVRADLARFLDEDALDEAIAREDPAAVRRWLTDFIQQDNDPSEGCLLAQIVIEAARNERIADLLQCADRWIGLCLDRALAAIVPGAERQACRARLGEIIMVLLTGMSQRRMIVAEPNTKPVAIDISAVVMREIDLLLEAETC